MKTKLAATGLRAGERQCIIQSAVIIAACLFCTAGPASAAVLIDCTEAVSGDMLSRGFYITNYPGVTLDSVTLEFSASEAGSYQIALDARAGAYDGPLIGSATVAVDLDVDPNVTLVTFNFPSPQVVKGSIVCFLLSKAAGDGVVYYSIPSFTSSSCPDVIQTEGTTPPLDTFRRQGVKITVNGREDWTKWIQNPDPTPTGMDVRALFPNILADDFPCTQTGAITNITVWGSWFQDMLPGQNPSNVVFTLSLHADIPAGQLEDYSIPGAVLWTQVFPPGTFTCELAWEGTPEWWYDPAGGTPQFPGDSQCFKYVFPIPPDNVFTQQGTATEPVIYWLDVQANTMMGTAFFGWKTRTLQEEHFMDDAVWIQGQEPYQGVWNELRYPQGHPLAGQSIDLAFAIETAPPAAELDFGDAPEGALAYPGTPILGQFPTCITVGPAGWIQHGLGWAHFGPAWDAEADGNAGSCPLFNPNTYDQDECFNDGDAGLMYPESYTISGPPGAEMVGPCPGSATGTALGTVCQTAVWGTDIDIWVVNNMPVVGYVNVLMDWDQNGIWGGMSVCPPTGSPAPEHVLVNWQVPVGYNGPLSGLQPPPFLIGPNPGYVWTRFTITEVPLLTQEWDGSGIFEDGETEDYLLEVRDQPAEDLDFGDAPDSLTAPGYPTLLPNGARHPVVPGVYLGTPPGAIPGANPDAEPDGQPTVNADGDDLNPAGWFDDEDGITWLTPLVAGQTALIQATASTAGWLYGWIDFGADSSWAQAQDAILIAGVPGAGTYNYPITVPASAVVGPTYARFRFTTDQVPLSYDGPAVDGEVEDYLVEIQAGEEYDCGDAPDGVAGFNYPTLLANNGAQHTLGSGLFLGALVDAEADGQPTPNADGDDLNPPMALDDEDGVTFPVALFSGVQNWVQVVANVPAGIVNAYFSMWIDLNGDGDWTDPGEQVVVDNGAVTGTQWYPFTPGAITATNSTYVRCRLSTQQGLTDQGPAPDGEVEDYEIPIAPVKWLQRPDLTPTGVDVSLFEKTLADDFRCSLSGPITDLHIWTSFYQDLLPENLNSLAFTLEIYSDVPVDPEDPASYSHPGELLWAREIPPFSYNAGRIAAGTPEWWHDPIQSLWAFPGDTQVFQYDFTIPAEEAFVQTEGTIYWLAVRYQPTSPEPVQLGWKSSLEHWQDDAVWFDPSQLIWVELRYGDGHPLAPETMDLAFAVTGIQGGLDFGDAPDPTYPTLLPNGARHSVVAGVHMGKFIDAEPDGQPDPTATGDDINLLYPGIPYPPGDEEGVTFTSPWNPGGSATFDVVCSVSGFLSVWIDFNADGDWADPGENPFSVQGVAAGTNTLAVAIPATTPLGPTFARFRFTTSQTPLADTGFAPDGEVEDYMVTVEEEQRTDFGDAPDPTYPTLLVNNGARHTIVPGMFLGTGIDGEPDGQPNPTATGDDINLLYPGIAFPPGDEDGVTFGTLLPGQPAQLTVTASVAGFLDAWIDFVGDGSWAEAGDQICTNVALVAGANVINFTVPPSTPAGSVAFGRFRYSTAGGLSYTGLALNGEVEDYQIRIAEWPEPEADLGDAPDSSNTWGLPMTAYMGMPPPIPAGYPTVYQAGSPPYGPLHNQAGIFPYLGAMVSFENEADIGLDTDGLNNLDPRIDSADRDGQDDGVLFPLTLPHCRATTLNYWVSASLLPPPGGVVFVNVWFDWNRDGDWDDMMFCPDGTSVPEWAVQNQPLPFPFPPNPQMTPAFVSWHPSLNLDPIWMRITLADMPWPGPGGWSGSGGDGPVGGYALGETEDYYLTESEYSTEPEFDYGDAPDPAYPTLLVNNGARHALVPGFFLGRQVDAEADGWQSPNADGDDNNPPLGIDDEDGVAFTNQLLIGQSGCMDIFLTSGPLGGRLDAWVDFNNDGDWNDLGEQVLAGQALVPGLNSGICFPVPLGAKLGPTFARFRLSTTGGLASAGVAQGGEVEDYLVNIYQPPNASGNLSVTNILRLVASTVTVWWADADVGLHYQLQSTVDLTNGAGQVWSNVGPHVIGPSNWQTDTNLPTLQFYRVVMPYTP